MPPVEVPITTQAAPHLRAFRVADTDAVLAIAAASREASVWSRESYLQLPDQATTVALVIEENAASASKLAGFLVGRAITSQAEVLNLAVAPESRRRGYAAALLRAAEEQFRTRGAQTVHLEVRQSNIAAIAFYEKYGFEPVGTRKDYYRDPDEPALTMSKRLESGS